jgi:hypothetical protein
MEHAVWERLEKVDGFPEVPLRIRPAARELKRENVDRLGIE